MKYLSREPVSPPPARAWTLLLAAGIALLPALPAVADPPGGLTPPPTWFPLNVFSALWTESAPTSHIILADDLADFEDHIGSQETGGYNLAGFESWTDAGIRRYAGIFAASAPASELVTHLAALPFLAERQTRLLGGQRLVDIEVKLVSGTRTFSGLFATGTGTEQVVIGADSATFLSQVSSLAPAMRLVAFDTWWEDDEMKVAGVFRGGAPVVRVALGLEWDDFYDFMESQNGLGYRLIDLEITSGPGTVLYSGRWRQADDELDWLAVHYGNENWLPTNGMLFGAGHDFSAVGWIPPGIMPAPTVDAKNLLDLEFGVEWWLGTPNHLGPVHNCGTPGPPRPPPC